MHIVSLTNDDLSLIVNGKPNDNLCLPFFNSFALVGYVPFTRACLKTKCVHHDLGEDIEDTTLQYLVQEYEQAKIELMSEGINVEDIFDAEIAKV